MNKKKILFVEDEADMLEIISDFLEDEGYYVKTSPDGPQALKELEIQDFDLLLSDIHMPKMKGFDLISRARQLYPSLKHALFTAYDVNSYITMAKKYDIGNIITKTSPFNFDEFKILINNLVTCDIFGLERFFKNGTPVEKFKIRTSEDQDDVIEKLYMFFENMRNDKKIKTVLRELITNAIYYGALKKTGDRKDEWELEFELPQENAISICYAEDAEKMAISIIDSRGGLTKKDILYWLERNIGRDKNGVALNICDEHGRGIFISREFIDRMIINIDPDKKTEIIVLSYFTRYFGSKPLIINEL
jgi:CheY-like chemotaxis protein/anti-sigma regulatory factor (Ser/Thr protein kinase)